MQPVQFNSGVTDVSLHLTHQNGPLMYCTLPPALYTWLRGVWQSVDVWYGTVWYGMVVTKKVLPIDLQKDLFSLHIYKCQKEMFYLQNLNWLKNNCSGKIFYVHTKYVYYVDRTGAAGT